MRNRIKLNLYIDEDSPLKFRTNKIEDLDGFFNTIKKKLRGNK